MQRLATFLCVLLLFIFGTTPSHYTKGVKHTARGPKPARCEGKTGPRDDSVK